MDKLYVEATNGELKHFTILGMDNPMTRYRFALWSLGGEDHWTLKEQEEWVISQYGTEVIEALKIASKIKEQ